jgi:Uma2 family endonuclease
MIQISPKLLTIEDFISQYGDDSRCELIDGKLIDLEPTGPHEKVAAFVGRKLNAEIDRLEWPYFIPFRCLVKPLSINTGFRPDVIVLDETNIVHEPLWNNEPVITLSTSIKLVAEVVSTNWQNYYARKVEDYSAMGIPEYWIVDYLGLGGGDYIGDPKAPTLSIYQLNDSSIRYQPPKQYRGSNRLCSQISPDLQLTAEQVFQSAKPGT